MNLRKTLAGPLIVVPCLISTLGLSPASAQSTNGSCNAIGGLASVSFTENAGADYVPNHRPLSAGTATFGIAALDAPGAFVAEYVGKFYRSSTGGCHWSPLGTADTSLLRLAAGVGEEAWAWSFLGGHEVWRIDTAPGGAGVELRKGLPADVLTLTVDPADGTHLHAVGEDGQIYESFDAATTWVPVGRRAPVPPLVYFGAINPGNPDNVMIGVITDGIWTTVDGGLTWLRAAGLSATGGSVNGFGGLFSRADSDVAWAMAIDLDQTGDPSGGRHIYRSVDGGLTFSPVVDQGNGVTLINGPEMADDPSDDEVLVFAFGSRFAGGVTLYRYDHATGDITANLNPIHTGVRALAIDPARPERVYVGFEGP